MSEQAWSKEPWAFTGCDCEGCYFSDGDGNFHAMDTFEMQRAVACVNALAGVPRPEGVPRLIAWAKRIQAKQKCECTCEPPGDYNQCDFIDLDYALHACGIEPVTAPEEPPCHP